MRNLLKKIKNYPFSMICIIAIWVLCLMDVPETPLDNVSMIDKWTHIVMYTGLCGTIWVEYNRNHRGMRPQWLRLVVWAWLMPALMSGVIELAQAYCTNGHRSGDWLDFFANSLGCTLTFVVFTAISVCRWRPTR